MRRDITEGQPGVPLRLRIRLPKICHPEVAPAALRENGAGFINALARRAVSKDL
jgi:hypothetical protein